MANYGQIYSGFVVKPTKASCLLIKFAALVVFCANSYGVLATQYTVGGSEGWNLGVDYKTWASQNSFKTGDSLLFTYGGTHSVLQVSEADYKACNTANALSTGTGGSTVVKLEKSQTYYFICGVAGHCGSGMQLSVKVGSASASSTPSTTPSTSTAPSSSTSSSTTSSSTDASFTPPQLCHNLSLFTIFTTLVFATFPMFT